jgi:hypothetical protein
VNKKIFQWFHFESSLLCCEPFLISLQCAEYTVWGTHAILVDTTDMHSFLSFVMLFCVYRVKVTLRIAGFFGLCPSSGILETRKHVLETGSVSSSGGEEDTYSVGSLRKRK